MLTRRQRRPEEAGPYWRQRGWQLSAGFLAAAVLLGGVVALTSGGDGSGRSAAGPVPVAAHGRPGDCRTDDSAGDALPEAAPEDVAWRMIGAVRVPVSPTAGPVRTGSTPWWCFAHTADGAVMAAHVITSQMGMADWESVAERQLVPGQPREMFVFKRRTIEDAPSQTADRASVATYTGFSVGSYAEDAASVNLLMRSGDGFTGTTVNLRWQEGDWKVLPYGNGSLYSTVRAVQNTTGYLLWGS
ncbi:hypothetical protein [Streptomyces tagetis]|uniref:DUF8175 domain-containing protein n=1 Tax=Streptomyces tagetis TaxID=2820809 RepID=A0A940XMJ4_9ACTN|nr:hypothetical protein [Streptomyces sp. RG38]MBQ0827510.1 hypothetical protein [Streptomyces sp. RG38]